jgi:putative two-component system response regulator
MSDTPATILVVDDVKALAQLLAKMLREKGFNILLEHSGPEALKSAKANIPDLILLDINMPGMDGYEVCTSLKKNGPTKDIPVIFISAMGDTTDKVKAFSHGAVDYITKPFEVGEVLARVRNHLDLKRLQQRLRHTNSELEARVAERTAELQRNVEKLQETFDNAIHAMAKVVEIRDPYTAGHQQRVAQLTRALAQDMGLDEETITACHKTAIIHDIGKIYVPAELLSKPGRLTETEFSLIKAHSQIGADIADIIKVSWPLAKIILQHHERLDGSGYPNGISGEDILLEARIIGVADVVEAMSSHRPYRAALGDERALGEIEDNCGRFYDERVVRSCLSLFRKKSFRFDTVS